MLRQHQPSTITYPKTLAFLLHGTTGATRRPTPILGSTGTVSYPIMFKAFYDHASMCTLLQAFSNWSFSSSCGLQANNAAIHHKFSLYHGICAPLMDEVLLTESCVSLLFALMPMLEEPGFWIDGGKSQGFCRAGLAHAAFCLGISSAKRQRRSSPHGPVYSGGLFDVWNK